ncbi:interleukin-17D isoform X3 [Bos indicus]|uniref:Interleukin-17D isoform X3 n=1 Tax=Bos indicus TaxID=9915 RepID=A0ABM4T8N7_BOSIN
MLGPPVWALVAGVLLALSPGRAGGAPKAGRRPARARGCADRPEELLEQLYGRLAAGVLGAFHHTLQLGPREQARNASCPAGGRPADRRFRPPTNLRSVSPWAYRALYRRPVRVLQMFSGCLCPSRDSWTLDLSNASSESSSRGRRVNWKRTWILELGRRGGEGRTSWNSLASGSETDQAEWRMAIAGGG